MEKNKKPLFNYHYNFIKIWLWIISLYSYPFCQNYIVAPNDIYVEMFRNYSHTKNNMEIYKKSFPFYSQSLLNRHFTPPSNRSFSRIYSSSKFWNNIPINYFNIWSSISSHRWSILVQTELVSDKYQYEILSRGLKRFNFNARFSSAILRYSNNNLVFQFGRAPIWWGQSWESSIIISRYSPSFDHTSLKVDFSEFQWEGFIGQLGSEPRIIDRSRIKRFIAGHRITWFPSHKKWCIGFGDLIIYTGNNRSIELFSINPIMPYFLAGMESETETSVESDNDNSIIFAYWRYYINDRLSFFGEFILDEFQIDKTDIQNALGWKLGLSGRANLEKEFTYEIELTRIDSWTYLHSGEFTTFQNLGHSIGYKYGPDCWSLFVKADYWINKSYLFTISSTYLNKGSNKLSTEWDSPGTRGFPFPLNPIDYYHLNTIAISRYSKFTVLEMGWSNDEFPNIIAFSSQNGNKRGSYYIKVHFIFGHSFNNILQNNF